MAVNQKQTPLSNLHIILFIYFRYFVSSRITLFKDAMSVFATLIIGQTFCNMLSILNALPLQMELQHFATNNVFLAKCYTLTTI